jgi:hypothetical protein
MLFLGPPLTPFFMTSTSPARPFPTQIRSHARARLIQVGRLTYALPFLSPPGALT